MRQGVQKWGQMHPKPDSWWGKSEIIAVSGCSMERQGEVRTGDDRRQDEKRREEMRGRPNTQRERN